MTNKQKKILKQFAFIIVGAQLVFTLTGFVENVNPSDCCHTKKLVNKIHSCCDEMTEKIPASCEFSIPMSGHSLSNCGCIHSNPSKNSDYTVQKNFELQKENLVAIISFYVDQQTDLFSDHFKQRIEKEHSPPLFLLDSILLI